MRPDLEVLTKLVDDIWELIFGISRKPKTNPALEKEMKMMYTNKKPKRARVKGRYKADDPTTKDVNEAWVGGKAPKRKSRKK